MARNSRREIADLHPDHFCRLAEGPKFFGLGLTQIRERIKTGDIPRPVSLCGGRAKGWFGWQILDWQKEQIEKAPEREARACEVRERKRLEREAKRKAAEEAEAAAEAEALRRLKGSTTAEEQPGHADRGDDRYSDTHRGARMR
jgi:predicted DNA-binding transcriptional regulator AlpA